MRLTVVVQPHFMKAHVVYNRANFGLRALYAWWDIDGSEVSKLLAQISSMVTT